MRFHGVLALLLPIFAVGCGQSGGTLKPETWTLQNGIRVVLLPVPGSATASIVTFLPMGLASDDAGKTQWAHLVEHMAIRSTHPPNSMETNAETLSDHTRLDFYG